MTLGYCCNNDDDNDDDVDDDNDDDNSIIYVLSLLFCFVSFRFSFPPLSRSARIASEEISSFCLIRCTRSSFAQVDRANSNYNAENDHGPCIGSENFFPDRAEIA